MSRSRIRQSRVRQRRIARQDARSDSGGKLGQKSAEDIYRKASSARTSFIAGIDGLWRRLCIRSGAHDVPAYAAPLVDLDAIDNERLPKGLLDPKICQAYRVIVLSKRNNCSTVATADPSDQEAVEKIKFATQLGVDWVIAECDKLLKLVDANTATATGRWKKSSAVSSSSTKWQRKALATRPAGRL